jgi:hypothetical protein
MKETMTAPYDYVLKRQEVYTYFDRRSQQHKQTRGNRFYHVNINCVRADENVPLKFDIPADVRKGLSTKHIRLFRKCGISN